MCWQVVDELLDHGADPNQTLTHGLANALCVSTLPVCEPNRSPAARIALVCILSASVSYFMQNVNVVVDSS